MLADVGARLQSVLAELRRLPGILGVTIARRDGILIAHSLPKTMDPKKIAAMAAAIVGRSEMAAVEMGLGSFNQSIVDTHIGMMMATGAGEEAILVTMLRNEANMGPSISGSTGPSSQSPRSSAPRRCRHDRCLDPDRRDDRRAVARDGHQELRGRAP